MAMDSSVLIIGAGINGLLSALKLKQAGLDVTVVDQGDIARESTWAGAGILSPLPPWDYGDEVNALSERGRALWPGLADSLRRGTGIDPEYWACGMLALGDFEQEVAQAWCRTHGWTCASPTPDQMDHLPEAKSALWLPGVAQARNPRLAKAAEAACRLAGIRLLDHCGVSGFEVRNGRIHSVHTTQGPMGADRYLVCGGAWSGKLLGEHALGLRIVPVRGQVLLFHAQPGTLGHIVYRQGKYLVPRLDGHILAGSTLEDVGFDKACTDRARRELLEFALETLPALKPSDVARQWAGLRPGSPGNLPTIARHPELANLYLNSGHFRYGVTMAPASAELLAELLLNRPTTLDARPYAWPLA